MRRTKLLHCIIRYKCGCFQEGWESGERERNLQRGREAKHRVKTKPSTGKPLRMAQRLLRIW